MPKPAKRGHYKQVSQPPQDAQSEQNRTESPFAITRMWHKAFLSALRQTGVVLDACEAAGIGRTVAYEHRKIDPAFKKAWNEALADATDLLEREAIRRARVGVREPVIYQGKLAGIWIDADNEVVPEGTPFARFVPLSITKYSDTLLVLLLKANRRKFRKADKTPSKPTGGPMPAKDEGHGKREPDESAPMTPLDELARLVAEMQADANEVTTDAIGGSSEEGAPVGAKSGTAG